MTTHLDSVATALIWLAGCRALSGADKPGDMRELRWKLSSDGMTVRLTIPTPHGNAVCTATLPSRMTEEEMRRGEWFGDWEVDEDRQAFIDMPIEGTA